MKTRRQFLALLAGLPFVGRLFGQEKHSTLTDGLVGCCELDSPMDFDPIKSPNGEFTIYAWFDSSGELLYYTDEDGWPVNMLVAS